MRRANIGSILSVGLLRNPSAIVSLGLLLLCAQSVQADPLNSFKNYFVTGDYVGGGVGLRGKGGATGFAKRNITIPDTANYPSATFVPDGADIVAAFPYWQTVEKDQSKFAGQNGFFNGYAIIGTVLGNTNEPCPGNSHGYHCRVCVSVEAS